MKREDYQRVKTIFQSAVEIVPEERVAFLDAKCGENGRLRGEVERLLTAKDSEFMEEGAIAQVADVIGKEHEPTSILFDSTKSNQFGHFNIIKQIGKGGMGEVFLAEDTSLDRKVAIKFLSKDLSRDTDKLNRFIQEAKAASALNHPNILTIHEIGQTDDTQYIASEYIEGRTLRDILAQKDLIPLKTILKITIQIAEALSTAHNAGIIHRDIKPENIMIRDDGYVKVLDFGLAKLTEVETENVKSEDETKNLVKTDTGMIMGTVSYMSPEQARGIGVDARTDIFSFGVLMYEMLTGKAPFEGETTSDLLVAILEKEPIPVSRYASDTPSELQHIVSKSLRKDKDERYQTMKSLLADLKTLKVDLEFAKKLERTESPEAANITKAEEVGKETSETSPAQKTIATTSKYRNLFKNRLVIVQALLGLVITSVLVGYYFYSNSAKAPVLTDKDVILITDFENKTGEEIFDGTLEQGLTTQLQQSPFLSIFPNAQAHATLKLMKRSPDEHITKELGREISQRKGLKAFITGTLTKLGSVYLLGLEAINTETGETIASVQAQADADDQKNVLDAMSKAATEMRGKLGESLSEIEKFDKPLADITTSSLEALKAHAIGSERNMNGDFVGAIQHYKRATEIDPDFAAAYNSLSAVYWSGSQFELAGEAAKKAFEMREGLSEREKLWVADNYYANVTNELDKSIEVLKLVKTTFPRTSTNNLRITYSEIGEHEKALTEALIDVKRAPGGLFSNGGLANTYLLLNRYAEARETVKAFQKKTDSDGPNHQLYQIAFIKNDEAEMQRQLGAMKGKPWAHYIPQMQASVASYRGQWAKAQEFYSKAVTLAEQNNNKGIQSLRLGDQALRASVFGKCSQIRSLTEESLGLERNGITISIVALALARCGDTTKVQSLINELKEKYPKATLVNGLWLPTIKAVIEINKGNAKEAVTLLETAKRYERSVRANFWPQYLRGEAYLALKENEKAKAEFQKILDNRGLAPLSELYPLAQLGKARALKNKREYEKFFEMWKDADKDLQVLIEAKKEYEKLK